jgi:hypothetical protein
LDQVSKSTEEGLLAFCKFEMTGVTGVTGVRQLQHTRPRFRRDVQRSGVLV